MSKRLVLCALSAGLLLAGCQSVNTTSGGAVGIERKQYMFSMLSTDEVNQMYAQSYQKTLGEARNQGVLDKTSSEARRVQAIADRLIAQAPNFRPDSAQWKWEVNLIKSDELNANCGPGGKIIFYTGLIDSLKLTDDEIAAIMGHEIAHALREHGREAMSKAYGIEMAKQGAGALFGLGQDSLALADTVANYGMTLPNSRANENEADLIGPGACGPCRLQPERRDHLVEQNEQGFRRRATGVHEHSPGVHQPYCLPASGDSESHAAVRESAEVLMFLHRQ